MSVHALIGLVPNFTKLVLVTIGGTGNYTFTPTAGQCASTYTMPITVDPLIIPALTQVPQLCQNDANPVLPLVTNNVPAITGTWKLMGGLMTLVYGGGGWGFGLFQKVS